MARVIDIRTSTNIINRTDAVTSFLRDARKYNVLTADEEKAVIARIKAGDESAKAELINANLRFIFSLANKFAQGDNIMDMVSEATIGAYEAIDKYDVETGTRFLSYAVHYMRMQISEHYKMYGNIVRKKDDARIGAKANKAENKFFAENGRYPSEDELIDMLNEEYGLALKERRDVVPIKAYSLDNTVGDEDEGWNVGEVGDIAMATASTNEFVAVEEAEQNSHIVEMFLSQLSIRDREIIRMAFGINEERVAYDNEAIAEKLGLTAERVRQIIEKTIKGMRSRSKYIMAHA